MKTIEEMTEYINIAGDLIFSALFHKTQSREKALNYVTSAIEVLCESKRNFTDKNQIYRYLCAICRKKFNIRLTVIPKSVKLTDDEREKIISSARIYISRGGKAKKRKGILITAIIFITLLVTLTGYCVWYIYLSEEHKNGFKAWQDFDKAKQEQYQTESSDSETTT